MPQEATIILDHEPGLHIRAAMVLVSKAQQLESKVTIAYGGQVADAKSIYALVQLCAGPQSELVVRCEGPDEVEACRAVVELIESGFNENPNGD